MSAPWWRASIRPLQFSRLVLVWLDLVSGTGFQFVNKFYSCAYFGSQVPSLLHSLEAAMMSEIWHKPRCSCRAPTSNPEIPLNLHENTYKIKVTHTECCSTPKQCRHIMTTLSRTNLYILSKHVCDAFTDSTVARLRASLSIIFFPPFPWNCDVAI